MDSYSLGVLVADYWYNNGNGINRVPATLQKAVQRMQTSNLKMRPRLQPLLKCPAFDTPYQKLQLQLEEIATLFRPVGSVALFMRRHNEVICESLGEEMLQLLKKSNGLNSPRDIFAG